MFFCALPFYSHAQEAVPLTITADHSLEWDRPNKIFTAKINAIAQQGETMISANTLTAYYREENGQSMNLYKITAEGNVTIQSKESIAYGDKAEYSVDTQYAIMTGHHLKMVSNDQTLTAEDNFEYWVKEGRFVANGNIKIIRPKENKSGQDILEADTLSAIMKDDSQGRRVFDTLSVENSIKITTPTEVITGHYGTYKSARNIAEINGNVKISRGKNILQGEKAVVDLNTNISRMFGQPNTGSNNRPKRVRGVFYPDPQKQSSKTPITIETPKEETHSSTSQTPRNPNSHPTNVKSETPDMQTIQPTPTHQSAPIPYNAMVKQQQSESEAEDSKPQRFLTIPNTK